MARPAGNRPQGTGTVSQALEVRCGGPVIPHLPRPGAGSTTTSGTPPCLSRTRRSVLLVPLWALRPGSSRGIFFTQRQALVAACFTPGGPRAQHSLTISSAAIRRQARGTRPGRRGSPSSPRSADRHRPRCPHLARTRGGCRGGGEAGVTEASRISVPCAPATTPRRLSGRAVDLEVARLTSTEFSPVDVARPQPAATSRRW